MAVMLDKTNLRPSEAQPKQGTGLGVPSYVYLLQLVDSDDISYIHSAYSHMTAAQYEARIILGLAEDQYRVLVLPVFQ